jgi:putative SOS response-associated peptidase YedK
MCGKFVFISDLKQIADEFNLSEITPVPLPHGDVHPGQKCSCVISEGHTIRLIPMLWGFTPHWPIKTTTSKLLINARAETLSEKPTFKESFQRRRCLIPADGFYEWSKDKKQFYFYPQSRRPFGLAAIYEYSAAKKEASFVIITTAPNKLIEPIHNRMPVIIPGEKQSLWLNNAKFEKSALTSLFIPYPEKKMEMRAGGYQLQ